MPRKASTKAELDALSASRAKLWAEEMARQHIGQADLSRKTGIHPSTVCRILRGTAPVSLLNAQRIDQALVLEFDSASEKAKEIKGGAVATAKHADAYSSAQASLLGFLRGHHKELSPDETSFLLGATFSNDDAPHTEAGWSVVLQAYRAGVAQR